MQTQKSVLINAFSQMFAKVGTAIIALFVVKMLTSFGADFYGQYVTTYEFLAFFGIVADAGLFAIAVREISRKNSHSPEKVLGNILLMRLALVFVIGCLAIALAQYIPTYSTLVKTGVFFTTLSMGLNIISGTLSSVLQSRMKIYFFSISLFIGKAILALLIFSFLGYREIFAKIFHFVSLDFFLDSGAFYMFLIFGVFSNLIFFLFVLYFSAKEVRLSLRFDWDYWKQTLKTALPYGASLVLQTLYLRIDMVLISMMLGATAIGFYGVTGRIMESILVLGVFFGQAIFPKISREEKIPADRDRTLVWGVEKLLILGFPIIIGGIAFAPDIILFISNSSFVSSGFVWGDWTSVGADTILIWLLPVVFFAFLNQLFSFFLVGCHCQNYLLLTNGVGLLCNVGLNILLLPMVGIIAAAWTTLFCEIVVFGFLLFRIYHIVSIRLPIKNLAIIFIANFLLLCLVLFTPFGSIFWLAISCLPIVYFGFLAIFWRRLI